MAQPRKHERRKINGVEHLVLHRSAVLKDLDTTIVTSVDDANLLMNKLRAIVHGAELWYWVETGFALNIDWDGDTDEYVWCIVDSSEASTRYVWLSTKARKFAKALVKRINESGRDLIETNELITSLSHGESLEEEEDGTEA